MVTMDDLHGAHSILLTDDKVTTIESYWWLKSDRKEDTVKRGPRALSVVKLPNDIMASVGFEKLDAFVREQVALDVMQAYDPEFEHDESLKKLRAHLEAK
jgi:hypothetical protein